MQIFNRESGAEAERGLRLDAILRSNRPDVTEKNVRGSSVEIRLNRNTYHPLPGILNRKSVVYVDAHTGVDLKLQDLHRRNLLSHDALITAR